MYRHYFFAIIFVMLPNSLLAQSHDIVADCVITPYQLTDLSSPVMGVLAEVLVEKSDRVKRGQVLARLESSVEQAAVALAKARAQIDSDVEVGRVNNLFDHKRQDRMDKLFKQKTVSEDIRDEVQREAELAKVRLRQAEDFQRIRALELSGMEARLAQKTIVAPFDGYVLDRYKSQGEFVEEQPILRLAQLDQLNIEAVLPIELFGQVSVGMQANILLPAFPDVTKTAQVVVVDAAGNAASSTFGVRLSMDNPNNEIPAGLRCQAQFMP